MTPFLLSALITCVLAAPPARDAQISGDRLFGTSGRKAVVKLGKGSCDLSSEGDVPPGEMPNSFKIVLQCAGKKQVLWDLAQLPPGSFAFDDPGFELRWAGDSDGDGKIDLKMNLSQKYSCTKEVQLLSTLANGNELVGIQGKPEMICGE